MSPIKETAERFFDGSATPLGDVRRASHPFAPTAAAGRSARGRATSYTGWHQARWRGDRPRTASKKRSRIADVIGPVTPDPIARWSTRVIGVSWIPVPQKNASSAR